MLGVGLFIGIIVNFDISKGETRDHDSICGKHRACIYPAYSPPIGHSK